MEATCFGVILIWCKLSYTVLPLYLASRDAGQASSAQLLINTPCCITHAGVSYILTSSQDGQLIIEADCSLKYVALSYALFTACVGIMTLTVCTVLIFGIFSIGYCPLFIPQWSNTLNIHVGPSWNQLFWGFLQ